jgi:putative DNA primase/helicase
MAKCPAHDDNKPSLAINDGDGKIIVHCHAGCTQDDVLDALADSGLDIRKRQLGRQAKTYDYFDGDGVLRYQIVRYEPKDFRQRQPDPNHSNGWIWSMEGVEPLPYRLPDLLKYPNHEVYIVEGEKDVDAVTKKLKLVATCNHMGAGKWSPSISRYLAGRDVVILPDNDEAGRVHAADVAAKLHGIAKSIRVVALPGLGPKGDVSDWIAAGGTAKKLEKLVDETPDYQPPRVVAAATETPPSPIGKAAFHGLAGDVVKAISPHTEADDTALLISFLTAFGHCIGRGPHYMAEATAHYPNLYNVLVGRSARSRKGTAWCCL